MSNQNQGKQKPSTKPLSVEEQLVTEKVKKETAVLNAEKNLAKAKAEKKVFDDSFKALDKKIKKGESKSALVVASYIPIVFSTLFFIGLGLAFGSHHDKEQVLAIPFITTGILTIPFVILSYRKKWKSEFFTTLIISIALGFVVMNIIPFKDFI